MKITLRKGTRVFRSPRLARLRKISHDTEGPVEFQVRKI
jgi:hypothetical protein